MATHARIRFASAVACFAAAVAIGGGMTACSFLTSYDGLTDGGAITTAHDAAVTDAASDASVIDASNADACTPGVTSCGVDTSGGSESALYRCEDDRVVTMLQSCTYGCVVQPSPSAAGQTVALCSPCFIGGKYCGEDKIGTDPNTLYVCNPDGMASVVQKCAAGCQVSAKGDDDSCK